MSEKPQPSDKRLNLNYVALKPGNYQIGDKLIKGVNITEEQALDYTPTHPMGIGDSDSAVFIYPQGTIEVIGKVYCWNRLLRPGVYGAFEKLRYLDDTIVTLPPNNDSTRHHAPYNKTIRVPNQFVKKNIEHQEWMLEYAYVSFQQQITTEEGGIVYPIPILNGELTLYPDGTFKTSGVVVRSNDKRLMDRYGYLGDYKRYASFETKFNSVTVDSVNPFNVYKLLSTNDDGSVTYGAIEENLYARSDYWLPIPEGLIPVNDGKITVSNNGGVAIQGTVLTTTGYRVRVNRFDYRDLYNVLHDGTIVENTKYIDTSEVWNPAVDWIDEEGVKEVVLKIACLEQPKPVYQYHVDNHNFLYAESESQYIFTFLPMRGWDKFTSRHAEVEHTLEALWNRWVVKDSQDNLATIDKTRYPWVAREKLAIGNKWIYPYGRYNAKGNLDYYLIIDHSLFWNPAHITANNITIPRNNATYKNDIQPTPSYCAFPKLPYELVHKGNNNKYNLFIPIIGENNGKVSSIEFYRQNNETRVRIQGKVVWKYKEEYYLLNEGDVGLDYEWPELVEKEGKYTQLFDVKGYFTRAPVFIRGDKVTGITNSIIDLDAYRVRTDGFFKLISRNITHHLTSYEKMLIDNNKAQYRSFDIGTSYRIDEHLDYYLNAPYTSEDTNIRLNYYSLRFNDILPWFFDAVRLYSDKNITPAKATRLFNYNHDKEIADVYGRLVFELAGSDYFIETTEYPIQLSSQRYSKLRLVKPVNKAAYLTQLTTRNLENQLTTSYLGRGDTEGAYNYRPTITGPVKQSVTLPTIRITVTTINTNPIWVFYRHFDELKQHTGSLQTNGLVTNFDIPAKVHPVDEITTVEYWYEDPYNEEASIHKTLISRK